ncbi:hypothetical protein [Nostoc sp.]|uniref:hypothetical protein n=1 Tax=Nostoc sp. TaxID=1180 RepID=UPI002FF43DA2
MKRDAPVFSFNPKSIFEYETLSIPRRLEDFDSEKYKYIYVFCGMDACSGLVLEDNPEKTEKMINRYYKYGLY